MKGNFQVRFGGGQTEKGPQDHLAGCLPYGFDPRRHLLTHDERVRGGKTTFRKFLVIGRWRPDWWERCRKRKEHDYDDQKDIYQDEWDGTYCAEDLPF